MEYRSLRDMGKTITQNIHKIPPGVDLVVGIPGTGMLAGSLIALSLNTLATDLPGFIQNRTLRHGFTRNTKTGNLVPRQARHVLLVTDSADSGNSLQKAMDIISTAGIQQKITTCAVYCGPKQEKKAEIIFEQMSPTHGFEWSLMHSPLLHQCCIDMDGLFIDLPMVAGMADMQAWREALNNARPLTVPTQPAGYLVTDHPDVFRNEIEDWLDAHKIRYKALHMPGNGEVRVNQPVSPPGTFKAQVYQTYPESPLFIESSDDLARRITYLTGRKVLSYCNQEIFTPELLRTIAAKQKRSYPSRVLRKINQLAFKGDPLIDRLQVPCEDPAET